MDLVIIFGPQAVGKMTVGEELSKLTGLKLFHNHMTIDLVLKIFDYETKEAQELIRLFRDEIMIKMSKSNQKGMIFTFVWAFDMKSDWDYIKHICAIFENHKIHFVELNADVETRLARNITDNRLNKKWTKRNTEWSSKELISSMNKYRLVSNEKEIPYQNYIRIDNSNLSAIDTARRIKKYFNLK
ncbi:AAA family ATPase [Mycoplasmatota bacterium]|nr:AAA family ATPase [Mycoplasmatota bacterium]